MSCRKILTRVNFIRELLYHCLRSSNFRCIVYFVLNILKRQLSTVNTVYCDMHLNVVPIWKWVKSNVQAYGGNWDHLDPHRGPGRVRARLGQDLVQSEETLDYAQLVCRIKSPRRTISWVFSVPTSAVRLVYQKAWYVLSCLLYSAYKIYLAAYRKE